MATGKTNSRWFRLLVGTGNTAYDLSGDSRTFGNIGIEYADIDQTGWSNGVINYQLGKPRHIFDGYQAVFSNAPATGAHDDRGAGSYTALQQYVAGAGNATFTTLFMGIRAAPAVGDPAIYQRNTIYQSSVEGADDGPLLFNMSAHKGYDDLLWQANVDKVFGVTLAANQSVTAAVENASVDNGASSASGLVASIYVTYSDGLGTQTLRIQDSPDDAAWSDLLLFDIDGDTAESDDQYVSGTIDRYIRFEASVVSSETVVWCAAVRL